MEYCVAQNGGSVEGLAAQVNDLIKKGWKPLGGIAIAPPIEGSYVNIYYQAMLKD
jgi:hypothetical protein